VTLACGWRFTNTISISELRRNARRNLASLRAAKVREENGFVEDHTANSRADGEDRQILGAISEHRLLVFVAEPGRKDDVIGNSYAVEAAVEDNEHSPHVQGNPDRNSDHIHCRDYLICVANAPNYLLLPGMMWSTS